MNNCQTLGKKQKKIYFVIYEKQLKINSDSKVKL